jgi:hypothetical protein
MHGGFHGSNMKGLSEVGMRKEEVTAFGQCYSESRRSIAGKFVAAINAQLSAFRPLLAQAIGSGLVRCG